MGVVLVMGFWPWMVMGHGFGWVKLGMGVGGWWWVLWWLLWLLVLG